MTDLVKSSREDLESETQRLFVKEFTDGKGHLTKDGRKLFVLFGIVLIATIVQLMFKWLCCYGKT